MKKAAAYIRVSTDEQAREGLSLDFQEQDIIKYCQVNNIILAKKYIDDGYSAKSLERPKWQEFEQEAHLYDYLIVWRLDRLSRNQLDTFHIIRNIIDRNGIKLICLDAENEDLETEQGMMMFTLKSMIAEAERRAISKRVSRAHEEKVKRGELLYQPPLGYKMLHGKAEIVEKDAETVKLAFQLVA
ncbi:MAG: recombinase family protein, partial [Culicoidibacterales bacterium]